MKYENVANKILGINTIRKELFIMNDIVLKLRNAYKGIGNKRQEDNVRLILLV